MPIVSLAKRFDLACRMTGVSQSEIADSLGLHRQTITAIKQGKLKIAEHAEGIAKALNVSVEWLTTGAGSAPSWAESHSPDPAISAETERLKELNAALTDDLHRRLVERRQEQRRQLRLSLARRRHAVPVDLARLAKENGVNVWHLEQAFFSWHDADQGKSQRIVAATLDIDPSWVATGEPIPDWYRDALTGLALPNDEGWSDERGAIGLLARGTDRPIPESSP